MANTILGIGSCVKHPEFGAGVVTNVKTTSYLLTFITHGRREVPISYPNFEVIEAVEPTMQAFTLADLQKVIRDTLSEYVEAPVRVELGERWSAGTLILKPNRADLASKEIPLETFFHKIVMIRDRLRTLEQHINNHKALSDAEKVDMQQYITRIYGSLTTFNILFKNTDDHFVGQKTK